jgi:hypothetical protein
LKKRTKKLLLLRALARAGANARSKQSFFASFCSQKEDSYFLLFNP